MLSQKLVILAKAGIQGLSKLLKFLDSRFHGNDMCLYFLIFLRMCQCYVGTNLVYALSVSDHACAPKRFSAQAQGSPLRVSGKISGIMRQAANTCTASERKRAGLKPAPTVFYVIM